MNFTDNQKKAIELRDKGLLVSAGAGSGKTGVLVARLMSYINGRNAEGSAVLSSGRELCGIDDFLIITYTKAAAAELKVKITEKLTEAVRDGGELRQVYLEQCAKLGRARISTIHSFCSWVIRENSHVLEINPNFAILEQDKAASFKAMALDKLLDRKYENMTDEFKRLVNTVGAGRDDKTLGELIIKISDKIQSHAHPEKWVAEQKRLNSTVDCTDVGLTPWGQYELSELKKKAQYWAEELERLASRTVGYPNLYKNYGVKLADNAGLFREVVRCIDISWDKTAEAVNSLKMIEVSGKNPEDPILKKHIMDRRKKCSDAISDIRKSNLTKKSDDLLKDIKETARTGELLLDLALEFNDEYAAIKKRYSVLDYSDLEHFAVKVLVSADGSPTEQAEDIGKRFVEIMVDEYQDVSEIQETIFNAISQGGKKLFCVGDIKQSIYSFRLANPKFFKEKYNSYPTYSSDSTAPDKVKILLSENFRSRKGILDFANSFFVRCMSETLGDVNYNTDVTLKYGGVQGDAGPATELILIDKTLGDDSDSDLSKDWLEARGVAGKIKELVESGITVGKVGEEKPITYGDIAILLRNNNKKGGFYVAALNELGIPVNGISDSDYFKRHEISFMVSLLDVIANPYKDIPIIAVLRSPVFDFSPNELSEIRVDSKDCDFYSALLKYRENEKGGELFDKVCGFLDFLVSMRSIAPDISIQELISEIYNRLNLTMVFGAMDEGALRRRNLISFIQIASGYDQAGSRGLFPFVAHLKRMAEDGKAPGFGSSSSGVIITSIHSSKGLQYPVVFLCHTAGQMNFKDSYNTVLIHHELGIGSKVIDTERHVTYPTLAHQAIAHRMKSDVLSEEMRLLYVALTRAKDYLFITGHTGEDINKFLEKNKANPIPGSKNIINPDGTDYGTPLQCQELLSMNSYLRWLVAACEDNPFVKVSYNTLPLPEQAGVTDSGDEEEKGCVVIPDFYIPDVSPKASLPTKITATELKGNREEDEEAVTVSAEKKEYIYARPNLQLEDVPFTAVQRGTITHRFLQILPLEKGYTLGSLKALLDDMTETGHFTQKEKSAVNLYSVARFFESDLGKRMLKSPNIRREFRFSVLVSARDMQMFEILPDSDSDVRETVFQGVIDCFFEEDDGLVLIDYKTDYVRGKEELEKKEALYRPQIESYAMALERITGKKIKEKKLWFLSYNQ